MFDFYIWIDINNKQKYTGNEYNLREKQQEMPKSNAY